VKIIAIATYPNTPTWNGTSSLNQQVNCKHFKYWKQNMHSEVYKKLNNGEKIEGFYSWEDGWNISITLQRGIKVKETSIQGYDELVRNMITKNICKFNSEIKELK